MKLGLAWLHYSWPIQGTTERSSYRRKGQGWTAHANGSRLIGSTIHGFIPTRSYYGCPVALAKARPCSRFSSLKSSSEPWMTHKTYRSYNTSATIGTRSVIQPLLLSEDWYYSLYSFSQNRSITSCQASKSRRNLYFPLRRSKTSGGSSRLCSWSYPWYYILHPRWSRWMRWTSLAVPLKNFEAFLDGL